MTSIPEKPEPITSDILSLIPFSDRFIGDEYISWLNSPDTTKYSQQRLVKHDRKSCESYLKSIQENRHFMWALVLKDNDLHVGNIVAYIDRVNQSANLTILIGKRSDHNKGIGSHAFNMALNWLLDHHIRKVYAGTMAVNKGMVRIMEKCNMDKEAILKKHFLLDGQEIDMVQASKMRN